MCAFRIPVFSGNGTHFLLPTKETALMKKTGIMVGIAVVLGIVSFCFRSPNVRDDSAKPDGTTRVANCVIDVNGKNSASHMFGQGEQIEVSGTMDIIHPPEETLPAYVAFLVALDHPKAKDVVADSGFLFATLKDSHSTFKGQLKTPKRPGKYELRVFFQDTNTELQAMDPSRQFYRVPVTVK